MLNILKHLNIISNKDLLSILVLITFYLLIACHSWHCHASLENEPNLHFTNGPCIWSGGGTNEMTYYSPIMLKYYSLCRINISIAPWLNLRLFQCDIMTLFVSSMWICYVMLWQGWSVCGNFCVILLYCCDKTRIYG